MEPTDEDYIKIINKAFNKIGQLYSKPKTMAFMADGETQELEEPDGTFSSMNFVWKLIMELPGKKYLLMNKEQSIRFIRIVKQRILKVLNNEIDFINIHLSRVERRAFNKKTNGRFIEKLTNKLSDIAAKYNITDEDLLADTPMIVKLYVPSPHEPSPPYESSPPHEPSSEYEAVDDSILIRNIHQFEDEMNLIDIEDEEKYKEKDTPDILSNIARLKKEFLIKFKHEINMIPKQYYDKEVKTLMDKFIQFYTERLTDIRKSAHFIYSSNFNPYGKTRIEARRIKEKTQQKLQLIEEYKRRAFSQNNVGPRPLVPRPLPPKPRGKRVSAPQNNTQTNNSVTLKKLPKPRARSHAVSQNNTRSNRHPTPKPRARSRAVTQNNTRKNMPPTPKPRARSRALSQNNSTL
jgi:hypothetical protein